MHPFENTWQSSSNCNIDIVVPLPAFRDAVGDLYGPLEQGGPGKMYSMWSVWSKQIYSTLTAASWWWSVFLALKDYVLNSLHHEANSFMIPRQEDER